MMSDGDRDDGDSDAADLLCVDAHSAIVRSHPSFAGGGSQVCIEHRSPCTLARRKGSRPRA